MSGLLSKLYNNNINPVEGLDWGCGEGGHTMVVVTEPLVVVTKLQVVGGRERVTPATHS